MDITSFIVDEGIISIAIGSIIAFSFTKFTRSFRDNIIYPFIFKTFRLHSYIGEFLSSSIELLIILIMVFISYRFLIYPLFRKELQKEKIKKEKNEEWRSKLLDEIKSIDDKIYNVNYGLN